MGQPLLVVDVQIGFLNDFTSHLPSRIARLIDQGGFDPVYFTRFVNVEGSPFRRILGWDECAVPPDTELAEEIRHLATDERVYSKAGYAGLPDALAERLMADGVNRVAVVGIDTDMCVLKVAMDLFDLNIEPLIQVDCCASTAGLQAHMAGLSVLARNIGADHLRDAGLSGGQLGAPS
jgi:nicotinamidase-related amidase